MPISSRLVAADAIWKYEARLRRAAMSRRMNSDMGERQILPWQINNTFIILIISLHNPSNLDITGFQALFSIFMFCPKPTQFCVNLHKFTGKWCSKWCSNLVYFQPDFLRFPCASIPLKSIIFDICSAARS